MSKKLNKLQLMSDPAVAAIQNIRTYDYYFMRLSNIAVSIFEWKNLPDTVDARFLEMSIFRNGMCLFFKDEVMGYLALPCAAVRAYSLKNYQFGFHVALLTAATSACILHRTYTSTLRCFPDIYSP